MTHAESIPSRDRWKSKLDVYRAALANTVAKHIPPEVPNSSSESYPVLEAEPLRLAVSDPEHGTDSKLHFPIDGIVKQVRRKSPYFLGIGTVDGLNTSVSREVILQFVDQLSQGSKRNTLVIRVRKNAELPANDEPTPCSSHSLVDWQGYGESKMEKKVWYAQLASLPSWRHAFGLILLDMGGVESPTFERLGRLCDGLILQLAESANSRPLIQKLKRIQTNHSNIIGVWSVRREPCERAA